MVAEQAIYRSDASAQESAWKSAKEGLASAMRLPRILPFRNGRIQTARAAYVTAFNAYLGALQELERRSQAILVFNGMIEETRKLAQNANDLVKGWRSLAEITAQQFQASSVQDRAT